MNPGDSWSKYLGIGELLRIKLSDCIFYAKVKFSSLVWRTDQQTDVMAFEFLLVFSMKARSNYNQYWIKLTQWLADWAVCGFSKNDGKNPGFRHSVIIPGAGTLPE